MGLVCVDTLYSVTSDQEPLVDLVEICERSGCQLIADESHALGIHGPIGNGLAAEYGVAERIAYRNGEPGQSVFWTGRNRYRELPLQRLPTLPITQHNLQLHCLTARHSRTTRGTASDQHR
jgi:hypothetical protein